MKLIQAVEIEKSYGKKTAVDRISFEVHSGEIAGLLGQNGAGKSTAFSIVIGMIKPDYGKVFFRGEDVTNMPIYMRARLGMGYLSQEPSVFQRLTVEENVLAVLETIKFNYRERMKKIKSGFGRTGVNAFIKENGLYTLRWRKKTA